MRCVSAVLTCAQSESGASSASSESSEADDAGSSDSTSGGGEPEARRLADQRRRREEREQREQRREAREAVLVQGPRFFPKEAVRSRTCVRVKAEWNVGDAHSGARHDECERIEHCNIDARSGETAR